MAKSRPKNRFRQPDCTDKQLAYLIVLRKQAGEKIYSNACRAAAISKKDMALLTMNEASILITWLKSFL